MDFVSEHCVDFPQVMSMVAELPVAQRLPALMAQAGCLFHPGSDRRLVAGSAVRMISVGGLSIVKLANKSVSPKAIAAMTTEAMAAAGAMSYLSLPGGSLASAYDSIVGEHGHTSVAHTVSVSLLVAGITCAVENEFNSQRDLVHLARVTEARTAVQSSPPVVVSHPSLVETYRRILAIADAERQVAEGLVSEEERRDALEALNLMYPASKATAVVLTGSLRNIQKLLGAETDLGKEAEYRRVLAQVRAPLSILWPALFSERGF